MHRFFHMLLRSTAALVLLGVPAFSSSAWSGAQPGVRLWRLPDMPNGSRPTQNWYSVGTTPDGAVYVTGCDHVTNSALYRIAPGGSVLQSVGDALSAARAAGNLESGETFQKFHVRPTLLDGKVYLASMDYSNYDSGYRNHRGFHWFEYDPGRSTFTDVSDNVGAGEKLQVEYLTADPVRHVLYASAVPTGKLLMFDPVKRVTTNLGRPSGLTDSYPETGGCIWVGSDGKAYFTMKGSGSIYDVVHYWDPVAKGFGQKTSWKIGESKILKVGQWSSDRKRFYMTDWEGGIYRYDDIAAEFQKLGQADFGVSSFKTRTFYLSPDEKYVYLVNDHWGGSPPYCIAEFEISSRTTTNRFKLSDLDPSLADRKYHGGHDAWVGTSFFFASFSMDSESTILTEVNPYVLAGRQQPTAVAGAYPGPSSARVTTSIRTPAGSACVTMQGRLVRGGPIGRGSTPVRNVVGAAK